MPQRSPECTAMKAIFSQNTVNVACKKINFSFAMASNQIQQSGLNSCGCQRTTHRGTDNFLGNWVFHPSKFH